MKILWFKWNVPQVHVSVETDLNQSSSATSAAMTSGKGTLGVQTTRLTAAQALVRWLLAQKIECGNQVVGVFAGVFGIFGHGNVVALGEALESVKDELPTWRGHNEQGMALAAVGYTKATRRRRIMVATSSIGPGATNMVTAAAVAHANRLPLLIISGDTFQHRLVDPALQQIEHFSNPSMTASDAFKPVTRYWDRLTRPEQIMQTLPQALAMMLDPEDCGPAYIGLPQDIGAEAYDYPVRFFDNRLHHIRRPPPDPREVQKAASKLSKAQSPLIVAGGGVHYSDATESLELFAESRRIPVVETVAGKSVLTADHPNYAGPIGVTGSTSANSLAKDADVVLAIGTRLQDFTTGSWSLFQHPNCCLLSINVGRFDATKHQALSVIGDAKESIKALDEALGDFQSPASWLQRGALLRENWYQYLSTVSEPGSGQPTYAQVVAAINELADPDDYQVAAAGGLPGELNAGWHSKSVKSFDCEYGYSCMGYEIAGAWGAKMALRDRDVIAWVGDGSYLMLNSDIHSTVFTGNKVIFIVCDNGGFAVINRLQVATGGKEFNNLFRDSRHKSMVSVDFVKHAESLGARAERVETIEELKPAFLRAKDSDVSYVIVIEVDEYSWTEGGAWWEVGIPEVSKRKEVMLARAELEAEKKHQRAGI